jgi:diketogulonate reductase-like aldo/keto reductase
MDLKYADLCLIHLPEIGPGTGSHGQYGDDQCAVVGPKSSKKPYDAAKCRVNTYANIVAAMNSGLCKSVGVNNWNVSDIQEIEKDSRNLPLPSVVQYKFHLHQSQNNQIQKDLVDYTKAKGIIFNGFAPLGAPDWVTFTDAGMAKTTLEEPVVKKIAAKMNKTETQILLRWVIQQGVATHARTSKADHMKENLDIFDFELSQDDMNALSKTPQCHTQRGLPYAKGDPNGGSRHDHVIGLTEHC